MKTNTSPYLIISLVMSTLAAPVFLRAATPAPSPSATPAARDRMEQLDQQLDDVFADTFRGFGNSFGTSALASSIDLREQKDKYIVRVYVPGADNSKVNARVEGDLLHVTAEGEKTSANSARSERYEQIISLPGPVQAGQMHLERKQNLVVISLPKAPGHVAAATPTAPPTALPAGADELAAFDQSIINQMARMQGRMEQMFRDAFPDEDSLTNGSPRLPLGSAVNLDNQKDQYVVRFYLPDKNLENVSVKLENGQLHLTASEDERDQTKGSNSLETGRYEQLMTLPGPVQEKRMKVQRENGTIVVSLPKA